MSDLVSVFHRSAEEHATRPLFGVAQGSEWRWHTYAEVADMVTKARSGLAGLGVGRGDRVAVISNNRLEWAIGLLAVHSLGATWVPMYENQLDKDWKFILGDSGSKVCLVANSDIQGRLEALRADLPILKNIVAFDGYDWTQLLASTNRVRATTAASGNVASLIYTSGTTGNPKGVRLTHENLASNVAAVREIVPFSKEDRSLSFLPWAHVFGGNIEIGCMVSIGGAIAICEDTGKLVDQMTQVRPTVLFAVPRIWNRIYDSVQKNVAAQAAPFRKLFHAGMAAAAKERAGGKLGLTSRITLALARKVIFAKVVKRFGGELKYAVSGAAALSKDVAEFVDNLGITVFEGYGMTECSGVASTNRPDARRIGSVGKPVPGVTIQLEHDAPGGDADVGEIVIYGPGVMDGYHNQPEETKKVINGAGGLRSGDLGRYDADGFLYVTGRVKELYKLETGKYVAPVPLEEQIQLSPYILQAMVHGSDKPYNVALIVPDLAAVRGWAEKQGIANGDDEALLRDERVKKLISDEVERQMNELKGYEKVKRFALIREEFTTANDMLTPTMKVKRRNVLQRYGDELARLYV